MHCLSFFFISLSLLCFSRHWHLSSQAFINQQRLEAWLYEQERFWLHVELVVGGIYSVSIEKYQSYPLPQGCQELQKNSSFLLVSGKVWNTLTYQVSKCKEKKGLLQHTVPAFKHPMDSNKGPELRLMKANRNLSVLDTGPNYIIMD